MAKRLDVRLQNEGSIVLFHLLSARARAFVRDNVDADGVSYFEQALVVSSHYVDTLVAGMLDHGLNIR